MKNLGLARILVQKELTAQKLLSEINKLVNNYSAIVKNSIDIVSPRPYGFRKNSRYTRR